MGRQVVSIKQLMNDKTKDLSPQKRAELLADYVEYRPKLYKNLMLPSYVHCYSLAIEFMQNWFLSNFTYNYFKTVHINGKHVLDDWKHFNNYNIKREKPMLAIVPTLNVDYDRENIDLYTSRKDVMLRRSTAQQSFFRDYDHSQFLYMQMREMEMNFTFKIRVNTRSEQLDLMNKLELWLRTGQTQDEHISADFHVPYDIMLNIAKVAAFEIDKNNNIVDIVEFLNYINAHSDLPIIFKMRAINQKPEFFVRARDLRCHIVIRDKIQIDDGERDGKLDTNFHLEIQTVLRMPVPHFYAYMNQDPVIHSIPISELKPAIGIYSIDYDIFGPENENRWPIVANTCYSIEKGEQVIDISPIFNNHTWNITKVIDNNNRLGIDSNIFLDLKIKYIGAHRAKSVNYHVNYKDMKIYIEEDIYEPEMLDIAIYADMAYINANIISMDEYNKNRFGYDFNNKETKR